MVKFIGFVVSAEELLEQEAKAAKKKEDDRLNAARQWAQEDGQSIIRAIDRYLRESGRMRVNFRDIPVSTRDLDTLAFCFTQLGYIAGSDADQKMLTLRVNGNESLVENISILSLMNSDELDGEVVEETVEETVEEDGELDGNTVEMESSEEDDDYDEPIDDDEDLVELPEDKLEIANPQKASKRELFAYLQQQGIDASIDEKKEDLVKAFRDYKADVNTAT